MAVFFNLTKKEKKPILIIIIAVIVFAVIPLIFGDSEGTFFVLANLIFFGIVGGIIFSKIKQHVEYNNILSHWAKKNGLQYQSDGSIEIDERAAKNPQKRLLKLLWIAFANNQLMKILVTLYSVFSYGKRYLVSGKINKRRIWIYHVNIHINKDTTISEWCFEIETNPIPEYALITSHSMQKFDNVDVESRSFENKYRVYANDPSAVLQLLEPNMISLLLHHEVDAVEFSDSSLIMYNKKNYTQSQELIKLDKLLTAGLKLAEQVERNFPLSKYA